jgi:uncharacterized protein YecT (DUF1311 family)
MSRRPRFVALALVATIASDAFAQGPSFDCGVAEGAVEEMICADAELAALDRKMDEVYRDSVATIEALDAPGDPGHDHLRAPQTTVGARGYHRPLRCPHAAPPWPCSTALRAG